MNGFLPWVEETLYDLVDADIVKGYDVPKGKWFYNDVNTAASLGIVSGINATQFAPNFITLILRHRTLKKKWSH